MLGQGSSVLFCFSILRLLHLRYNHTIILTIEVVYLSVSESQQALPVIGFRRHDVDDLQQTSSVLRRTRDVGRGHGSLHRLPPSSSAVVLYVSEYPLPAYPPSTLPPPPPTAPPLDISPHTDRVPHRDRRNVPGIVYAAAARSKTYEPSQSLTAHDDRRMGMLRRDGVVGEWMERER
ncbi:hypothetical protein DFP72DRAFT_1139085 [Ephemerocybe angulata]|uniref:Uncharacterized protein n=1 Tax=Ephemerocybe angulata TaxID=980116 RepID=A0A8H6HS21_9AGAR|nr:hypothetical protein DFP72DRAFT_1139085 [Tulosesus angulatus]